MHKLWINRNLFFWFLFFLPSLPVFSTVVEGKDAEYAGKKLNFFRYADPVTKEKKPVFSLKFDAEGNFSRDIDIETTTFVFCDFGIYRGMLFLEPQKKLTLLFPPFRTKSFADQKNPFFEPVSFWIATKSKDHLNDQVSAFDSKLNQNR